MGGGGVPEQKFFLKHHLYTENFGFKGGGRGLATFFDRSENWHSYRTHISKGSGTFSFSKSPKHHPYEIRKVGEKGCFWGVFGDLVLSCFKG